MAGTSRFVTVAIGFVMAVTGGVGLAGQIAGSATAAISGVVVDATSGRPVSNVIVTLALSGPEQVRLLTDSRGRFLFRGLPSGDAYVLTATKAGYFDGRYGAKVGRATRSIALVEGQWFPDARIELVRPGSISGVVLDEAGEPVIRAFVRVLNQMWIGGRQQWAATDSVQTDDRGQYRVGHLAAGNYVVSVPSVQNAFPSDPVDNPAVNRFVGTSPALDFDPTARLVLGNFATPPPLSSGVPALAYAATFHPGTTALTEADVITLGEAEDRAGVDMQIRPVPTWRVSGRVEDASGSASGLTLRLMARGTEALGFGSEVATTVVDRQGRFTFLNVPAGRYTIDARQAFMELRYIASGAVGRPLPLPGLGNARGGAGVIQAGPMGAVYSYSVHENRPAWGRQEIEVSQGDLSNLALQTHPGVTLSGRAVWEQKGKVEPTGGRIIAVHAEPAGPASLGMPTGAAETGAVTTFSVSGLLPGPYLLRPFGGGRLKSIVWDGRDYTYTPFDASMGRDFTDIVMTFTDQTSALGGTVSMAGPNGTVVLVFPTAQDQWPHMGLRPLQFASVAVPTTGRYMLNVPAGDYHVIAVDIADANAWQNPAYLERAARIASRIALSWGETATLDLKVSEVR